MEEPPCLPWPGNGRGARFGGGGSKLSSWKDFWGLVHNHLTKEMCCGLSFLSSWASLNLSDLPRSTLVAQVQLCRGVCFS